MIQVVNELLAAIENKSRQNDAFELLPLMQEWSGYKPHQAGSMVGFGRYHYRYESGREGDFFVTGFAPRKQNIAVYIMPGFEAFEPLLKKLGKHKIGKSCLYINKLSDIDISVLGEIVSLSVSMMKEKYPCSEFIEHV